MVIKDTHKKISYYFFGILEVTASTATYTSNTNNTYGSVYGYAPSSNPQMSNIQAKESNMDLLTG